MRDCGWEKCRLAKYRMNPGGCGRSAQWVSPSCLAGLKSGADGLFGAPGFRHAEVFGGTRCGSCDTGVIEQSEHDVSIGIFLYSTTENTQSIKIAWLSDVLQCICRSHRRAAPGRTCHVGGA